MPGSNRRHPACKAGALPTELTTHVLWSGWLGSNQRSSVPETDALPLSYTQKRRNPAQAAVPGGVSSVPVVVVDYSEHTSRHSSAGAAAGAACWCLCWCRVLTILRVAEDVGVCQVEWHRAGSSSRGYGDPSCRPVVWRQGATITLPGPAAPMPVVREGSGAPGFPLGEHPQGRDWLDCTDRERSRQERRREDSNLRGLSTRPVSNRLPSTAWVRLRKKLRGRPPPVREGCAEQLL